MESLFVYSWNESVIFIANLKNDFNMKIKTVVIVILQYDYLLPNRFFIASAISWIFPECFFTTLLFKAAGMLPIGSN
jgi:hypothetical protein